MNIRFSAAVLLFYGLSLSGEALDHILMDHSSGRITSADRLFYEALLAYSPENLPLEYRQEGTSPIKCGFGLQARLHSSWNDLSYEQQAILKNVLVSFSLELSAVSRSGLFRMHYTNLGTDAVPQEDADLNGVPDLIDEAGRALDLAYSVIVEQMGFRPPPQDDTDGPEWDAYFRNSNFYGETGFRETISRDPWIQVSYMNMDNDFTHTYSQGIEGLRVTCAHEFFHMVQTGYQFRDHDIFLMEASATWMEDVVYDEINDYVQYTTRFLSNENISFDYTDTWHEYGLSLWFHFLSDRYGESIIKILWEEIVDYPAFQAMDSTLEILGSGLSDEIGLFYGWNLMTGSRADTVNYYPEGNLYPEQRISESLILDDELSVQKTVKRTAARYIRTDLSDGSELCWTMVNANWEYSAPGEGILSIHRGESGGPYEQEVADSVFAMLVSDQGEGWRFSVRTESPGLPVTLTMYPEFNTALSSLDGTVWIYELQDGNRVKQGGIQGVTIDLKGAGADSVLNTTDDVTFTAQETDDQGKYRFFGMTPGSYFVSLDISTIPDPYITMDGIIGRNLTVIASQPVEEVDFGFHKLGSGDLPASVPNPFKPSEWHEMIIPFVLEEADLAELFIFSSQGFRVYEDKKYFENPEAACFHWDGRNDEGPVPGGIYVYVIVSQNEVLRNEKIAIIR